MAKIIIDFDVESTSPKNLVVVDGSEWEYSQDLPAYISITLPGSKKAINFPFKKQSRYRFNSNLLGLTCFKNDCGDEDYSDLPDGIYTICLKSGYEGIEQTKYYLKTDLFKRNFASVGSRYGLEYSEDNKHLFEDLNTIQGLIIVAESHTYSGNFIEAQKYFNFAKSKLGNKLNCM